MSSVLFLFVASLVSLVLAIWLLIRIGKHSITLAIATFLLGVPVLIALVRWWGDPERDIRTPFFASLLASAICVFAVAHTGAQARRGQTEISAAVTQRDLEGDASDKAASARQVVMFTTSHCPYCKEAKAWLVDQKIPYTEYDVEQSPVYLKAFREAGGRGVPTFVINGEVHSGFEPLWILAKRG